MQTVPLNEKELLAKISRGWEPARWARYHDLTAKGRDETLSAAEYLELATLIDEREVLNADRLAYLIALSELRGVGLDTLMNELDIPTAAIA